MKIIFFIRNSLHLYPPCLSQILYLDDLGQEVLVCFGDCDLSIKKILEERGIQYIDFNIQRGKNKYTGKFKSFINYKKNVKIVLETKYNYSDILWFGTADSVFFLRKLLKSKKYVVSILELYDDNKFYKRQIGNYINEAELVISCEVIRSRIMKSWWNLDEVPFTLPNKPYEHPRQKNLPGSTELNKKLISKIKGKNIVLYQGIISSDRELKVLAQALKEINKDYYFVLIGTEFYDSVSAIQQIYDKTIYLGFIPAPLHLEITSYASIGIANYDDSSLNNLFCAPNKIYEYSGFGIPTLCSDVIGLTNTIGKYEAGVCCDFTQISSIKQALFQIANDEKHYEKNAKLFFEATDNLSVMKELVARLTN